MGWTGSGKRSEDWIIAVVLLFLLIPAMFRGIFGILGGLFAGLLTLIVVILAAPFHLCRAAKRRTWALLGWDQLR